MKNIVFSTTRQWNPGDEIILEGIINLLNKLDISFNPIIFNRNPDVRGEYVCSLTEIATIEDACTFRIKTAMKDNSVKPWHSYDNIDAIIMSGTPEWQSERCKELFVKAVEYSIPVFFVGIDGNWDNKSVLISTVLKASHIVTVRNPDVVSSFTDDGIKAECMVCPSLFSSETEKVIEKVGTIGLIYRADENLVSQNNGWDEKLYRSEIKLYHELINKYSDFKFEIICHYIDELYFAEKEFPNVEVRYSFDSKDYLDIYRQCDLVIGSRIHGIGIASSLGIPCIPVKYDNRKGTLDLFIPKTKAFHNSFNKDICDEIQYYIENISDLNCDLIKFKNAEKNRILKYLGEKISFSRIEYDYTYIGLRKEYRQSLRSVLLQIDRELENQFFALYIREIFFSFKEKIKNKKIIIKGAGWHTQKLLDYIGDVCEIIAVADSERSYFNDIKCIRDKDITNFDYDYIIISSKKYEKEMIEDVEKYCSRKKILSIYDMIDDNYRHSEKEFDIFYYMDYRPTNSSYD